jgi:hypothetical protein
MSVTLSQWQDDPVMEEQLAFSIEQRVHAGVVIHDAAEGKPP